MESTGRRSTPVKKPKKKLTSGFPSQVMQALFTVGLSATLIATGGFGTFPPNTLTQSAGQIFSDSFPVQIIAPFNNVLSQLGAPLLPPPQVVTQNTISDFMAELFSPAPQGDSDATLTAAPATATPESTGIATPTGTPTLTPTPSVTPTLSSTATVTSTITRTATITPTRTYLPTWTPSPPPTPVSAGYTVLSFNLNGGGRNITVLDGSTITMDYTFQAWGNSASCAGCAYQLVFDYGSGMTCRDLPGLADYPGQTITSSDNIGPMWAPDGPPYTVRSIFVQSTDCGTAMDIGAGMVGATEGTITVLFPTPSPVVPSGHTITNLSLNGGGNSATVIGGSPVTWDYAYQVWGDSSTCLGCDYQLVLGLENSWKVCYPITSPGDYPAGIISGTDTLIDNAPSTPGLYTIYSFYGQYADCTAAIAAYSSAVGTAQGTISVP